MGLLPDIRTLHCQISHWSQLGQHDGMGDRGNFLSDQNNTLNFRLGRMDEQCVVFSRIEGLPRKNGMF
jgi:hypothetical protein